MPPPCNPDADPHTLDAPNVTFSTESSGVPLGAVELVRELGPWPDVDRVNGVTYDGSHVWCATNDALLAVDPASGSVARSLTTPCSSGTAYDGRYLYQLDHAVIRKLDPDTGELIATLPAPGGSDAGLTWAEGTLWVAHHKQRLIYQIDANTGAVLRRVRSDRFVTGVTWVNGELWHATWEADQSELRRVAVDTEAVLERFALPKGAVASGVESDGADGFYIGGASSGHVRHVRPKKRELR